MKVNKLLTEAPAVPITHQSGATQFQNLDLDNAFQEAYKGNRFQDIYNLMLEFGNQQPYKDEWEQMLQINWEPLVKEAINYQLTSENPFFRFLSEYYAKNNNITNLISSKYNEFHNAIVKNNLLTLKELSFKIEDEKRIKIIINANLWLNNFDVIDWLIKLYKWFMDANLNKYVNNIHIRRAFMLNIDLSRANNKDYRNPDSLTDASRVNMNAYDIRVGLRRACMHTDLVKQITEAANGKLNNNALNILNRRLRDIMSMDADWDYSTPFKAPNFIQQQVNLLRLNVQESNRDIAGLFQSGDTGNNQGNDEIAEYMEKRNLTRRDVEEVANKLASKGLNTETIASLRREAGANWPKVVDAIVALLGSYK